KLHSTRCPGVMDVPASWLSPDTSGSHKGHRDQPRRHNPTLSLLTLHKLSPLLPTC
uniref:Uncharacterized protein n=1 Tax=Amazona collaria TaxID=241587 RepID=A0A8B9GIG7_9PSIT